MRKSGRKERLDQVISRRRPDLSRSRIQGEIMAGRVLVDGKRADKPGTMVAAGVIIEILDPLNPYVSRGGLKIAGALDDLNIDVAGLVVLDVGASTGGFTDCLLQKGAGRVYALDVGYGQLDLKLRRDPRVVVMERFNIRRLEASDIADAVDLAVVDVSFISLTRVLPVLCRINVPFVLALIKPQFEAGRASASRGGGVIRDPAIHCQVIKEIMVFACREGYCCLDYTFSRFPGPKGNLEYFLYLQCRGNGPCRCPAEKEKKIADIVAEAHRLLVPGGGGDRC